MTEKKTNKPYTASLKIWGKVFKGKGKTPVEAIGNINPGMAKAVSVLVVEHKGKKVEKILPPMQSSRIFNSHGMQRDMQLKNISIRIGL